MRNHHHAAGKLQQGIFQRAQRFDVEIIGRFIQQQHVAPEQQRLGQMQTSALAAGQVADFFLLIPTLEIEAPEIGARLHLETADGQYVGAIADVLEHGLVIGERLARLVDQRQLDRLADCNFTAVGLVLAGDHVKQRGLACPIGADDAHDRPGGNGKAQIVDQKPIAKAFRHILEIDHVVAETLGHRNKDFLGFVTLLVFEFAQFVKAGQTRLALGLPALRILPYPFELLRNRFLARRFVCLFLLQPVALLFQP